MCVYIYIYIYEPFKPHLKDSTFGGTLTPFTYNTEAHTFISCACRTPFKKDNPPSPGTNGKTSVETYTLTYVTQRAHRNVLHDSGKSTQASVTTERGGMGGR